VSSTAETGTSGPGRASATESTVRSKLCIRLLKCQHDHFTSLSGAHQSAAVILEESQKLGVGADRRIGSVTVYDRAESQHSDGDDDAARTDDTRGATSAYDSFHPRPTRSSSKLDHAAVSHSNHDHAATRSGSGESERSESWTSTATLPKAVQFRDSSTQDEVAMSLWLNERARAYCDVDPSARRSACAPRVDRGTSCYHESVQPPPPPLQGSAGDGGEAGALRTLALPQSDARQLGLDGRPHHRNAARSHCGSSRAFVPLACAHTDFVTSCSCNARAMLCSGHVETTRHHEAHVSDSRAQRSSVASGHGACENAGNTPCSSLRAVSGASCACHERSLPCAPAQPTHSTDCCARAHPDRRPLATLSAPRLGGNCGGQCSPVGPGSAQHRIVPPSTTASDGCDTLAVSLSELHLENEALRTELATVTRLVRREATTCPCACSKKPAAEVAVVPVPPADETVLRMQRQIHALSDEVELQRKALREQHGLREMLELLEAQNREMQRALNRCLNELDEERAKVSLYEKRMSKRRSSRRERDE
jgi:hypothetical protein